MALLWTWHYSWHYWPFSPVVRFNGTFAFSLLGSSRPFLVRQRKFKPLCLDLFLWSSTTEKRHLIYDTEGILDECVTFVAAHPSTSNYIWVCFFKGLTWCQPIEFQIAFRLGPNHSILWTFLDFGTVLDIFGSFSYLRVRVISLASLAQKNFAFEGKLELKLKCLKILWKVCSLGNKSVVGCCCHLCFCTWLAQWYTSLSDWICNCARSMWMMKMVEALRTSFSSAAISSQASHPKTQFWAFLSERSEITRTLSLKYEKGPKLSKRSKKSKTVQKGPKGSNKVQHFYRGSKGLKT